MTQRETRISDARLAELIFDVDHEVIPDTGSEWCKLRERYKADHLAALRELAAMRREGWVLVPKEPTGEMWSVGKREFSSFRSAVNEARTADEAMALNDVAPLEIYRAMLAAVEDK